VARAKAEGVGFMPQVAFGMGSVDAAAAGDEVKDSSSKNKTVIACLRPSNDDQVFGTLWRVPVPSPPASNDAENKKGAAASALVGTWLRKEALVKAWVRAEILTGCTEKDIEPYVARFKLVTSIVIPKGANRPVPCYTLNLNSAASNTKEPEAYPSDEYRSKLINSAIKLKLPGLYRIVLESYRPSSIAGALSASHPKNTPKSEDTRYLDCYLSACDAAAFRALEIVRPDALVTDPLACLAAGTEAIIRAVDNLPPGDGPRARQQGLRARYLDDFVRKCMEEGCTQIVELGAGFDARGMRLAPACTKVKARFYEVDVPPVIASKSILLKSQPKETTGHITLVAADLLSEGWESKLKAKGFDASLKTAWIAEAVLKDLKNDKGVSALLQRIRALSAKGSYLAATVMEDARFLKLAGSSMKVGLEELMKHLNMSNLEGQTPEKKRGALQDALGKIMEMKQDEAKSAPEIWSCAELDKFLKKAGWELRQSARTTKGTYPKGVGYLLEEDGGCEESKNSTSAGSPSKFNTYCFVAGIEAESNKQ